MKVNTSTGVRVLGTDPTCLLNEDEHAYNALPEPYKADNCLLFWIEDSLLFCRPTDEQVGMLGAWVASYDKKSDSWEG